MRSASHPNSAPPTADEANGSAISSPLVRSPSANSSRTSLRTNEYSRTSIASSIHPSDAATSARRAAGGAVVHQPSASNRGREGILMIVRMRSGGVSHESEKPLPTSILSGGRGDEHAGGFECSADRAREGGCARRVAVDAQRVRPDGNVSPLQGAHPALADDGEGASCDHVGVPNDGAPEVPRSERAVREVRAVG